MKKHQLFLLLCSFTLLLFACKKDDTTIPSVSTDPRDAFVGVYQISYSGNCGSGAAGLIVKKGSLPNQLLFTDPGKTNYEVNLDGSSFTIPTYPQDSISVWGGIKASVKVSGNGNFGNNAISYIETTAYGAPYNSTCTNQVVGTK